MMQALLDFDTQVLLLINGLSHPVLDTLFWWVSDRWIWIPFYAFLLYLYYRTYRRNTVWAVLVIALLILLCDQTASGLLKGLVMRLRPCHEPELAGQIHLVNGYCGGKFGFVSSHAANSAGLAAFFCYTLGSFYRRLAIVMIAWACIIMFSRVYLGAHYPGDVLGGALVGWFNAWVLQKGFRARVKPSFLTKGNTVTQEP